MFRFLFTMLFYVIVARWIYAEVNVICPSVSPGIDRMLSALQIPTHNEWSKESVKQVFSSADSMIRRISHDASAPLASYRESIRPSLEAVKNSLDGSPPSQELVNGVRILEARRL